MLEQPFPAGADACLALFAKTVAGLAMSPVTIGKSLDGLIGLYDVVNIKLDKTGGLTEALKMKASASQHGFEVMSDVWWEHRWRWLPLFF